MDTTTTEKFPTKDELLAVILAGARTQKQIGDLFGIALDQVPPRLPLPVWTSLNSLVCASLLCMKPCDDGWHYIPTRKARNLAAERRAGAEAS